MTDNINEQLKRAYLTLDKLKQRLTEQDNKASEPIAIVGIGCRFPGGVDSPEDFWQLLSQGKDGICEVPRHRWDIGQFYSDQPGAPGKMTMREAAFIGDPGYFDADFFGISPREAKSMDPQQRLLLEVCREALENANIVPETLQGSDTGMFLGIGQNDYGLLQLYADDYQRINTYDGSGNGFCFAAGRLSYVFGWQGPCLAVDTACSSSLVALHLACQSLRGGECKTAVVAGVQLMLTPNVALFLSRVGALAADGRSKSFDAAADGYGRGEGCGAVVLKRLGDAQRDGDDIVAVIRGSAVNHDGPGSGLTVPNGLAQQQLIAKALRNARVQAQQVGFVEAHGTGTVLGDPIEAEALGAAYNEGRAPDNPLYIGSVKTNVGHLEAAAGIASLIKAALALQHGQIPANVGFKTPNPYIPWQRFNLKVPTTLTDWQTAGGPRYAGVSSFGMSGTNAHVIMEQAGLSQDIAAINATGPYLLAVSAKTDAALQTLCLQYAEALERLTDSQTADFCFTANTCRAHFARRVALLALDRDGLVRQLRDAAELKAFGGASGWKKPKLAFLFTGQGSQAPAMGRRLYETEAVFRAAVDQCDTLSTGLLPVSVKSLLCDTHDDTVQKTHAQPAIFTLQYALLRLWDSWGVKADFVLGHSIGEYAAACHAGVFSLADGLRLICARSRCINADALPGGMAAVAASAERVQDLLAEYAGRVVIAAHNAPQSCVVSGVQPALAAVVAMLEQAGLVTTALNVAQGFHSPAMEPVLPAFADAAAEIDYRQPELIMVSTLTGQVVGEDIACADYWSRHIRQPVLFYPAITQLLATGAEIMLEIGARPVLSGLGKQIDNAIGQGAAKRWLPSLVGKTDSRYELLQTVAELYTAGVDLDWQTLGGSANRMQLPVYPWQRDYYWVDAAEQAKDKPVASSSVLQALADGDTDALLQQLWAHKPPDAGAQKQALELLQALTALHQAELQRHRRQACSYRIDWQPYQLTEAPVRACRLVVADRQGRAAAIAQHWTDDTVVLISPGAGYENLGPKHYRLRLDNEADWLRCFAEMPAECFNRIHSCIHFSFCDISISDGLTDVSHALAGVATLCRVLHAKGCQLPVWLVTENAQAVKRDDSVSGWLSAAAWGLGRVLALEWPAYFAGLLDMASASAHQQTRLVADLLATAPLGGQLAVRADGCYIASLVENPLTYEQTAPLHQHGDYLVTGGLGGLGLVVAEWLAANKAGRIWLVSRRPAHGPALQAIGQLREQGCDIRCVQADISDAGAVAGLIAQIGRQGGLLKGVIHAAGVLQDARLESLDAAAFNTVLAAKAQGAWLLHQATAQLDLDFFVLFSSAASVFGSIGQGAYAAANAAMDSLAHYRKNLGLPALTINWGAWADAGMVAALSVAAQRRMQANGIVAMPKATGSQLLACAMAGSSTQQLMIDMDWAVFKRTFSAAATCAFWAAVGGPDPYVSAPAQQTTDIKPAIAGLDKQDAYRYVSDQIEQRVKQVLYMPVEKTLDSYQGFFDMGLDSITVVELRLALERQFACALPATLLFDCPNIHDVAEFLLQQLAGEQMQAGEVAAVDIPIDATTIHQYSEQELDKLISEKLKML
ncbi:MAG: type I polyketide synthase [Aquabacterium sp.]|uniref:type I polyketide synthase n=1 Tax=Aquabacterium sp. TaxID=1872578 RepID=UPI0027207A72|nr:type I polyketide synthase [Aquabacterium sp.]MDO9003893.1 type I polyketide synthase [Aquabacterium sp.]